MSHMKYGKLYLVATPIGNLGDLSPRAIETLSASDLIACEDTRHSLKLFNHFGISKPLTSYFEHNRKEKGEYIISELKSGKNVSLVTDAGTPAISDPGEDLVRLCIEEGIEVLSIPGPAALINALVVSGQSTGRFCFEGFLSVNKKSRREHLESLRNEKRTMIFYEAPHKLVRTLCDMAEIFGDRELTLVREITKLHEEKLYVTLTQAIKHFETAPPKGEYVIVLAGKSDEQEREEALLCFDSVSIKEHVDLLIGQGLDKKEAIRRAAKERAMSRRDVYNEYERS